MDVQGGLKLGLPHWRPERRLGRAVTFALLLAALPARRGPATAAAPVQAGDGQHLPLVFEANRGQTAPAVRFLARSRGQTLLLTPSEAVLVLTTRAPRDLRNAGAAGRGDPAAPAPALETVVRMAAVGDSTAPAVVGEETLPGTANYFRGNDPSQWHTGVPTYARVRYRGLYPGIDLVYYGHQGHLEADFVVAAGANPGQIALHFAGAERLKVDARGDLVLRTARGAPRLRRPTIYQEGTAVGRR